MARLMARINWSIQMALVLSALAFFGFQAQMFLSGTECSNKVQILEKSERQWADRTRRLLKNVTVLQGDLKDTREQVVTLQAAYEKARQRLTQLGEAGEDGGTGGGGGGARARAGASWAARVREYKAKERLQALKRNPRLGQPEWQRARAAEGLPGSLALAVGGSQRGGAGEEELSADRAAAAAPPPPPPAPATVAAVVVMACNRVDYLDRTLKSVRRVHAGNPKFPLFISQDGLDEGVKAKAAEFEEFTYMQHIEEKPPAMKNPNEMVAYYRIADHYKWALGQLFDERQFEHVLILEDDMDLAPDFFDFFEATSALLDTDDSILAISSWNDNGQGQFVHDPELLYRSDFFPGLGWMLARRLWQELAPKWPKAYWDDWLRLDANRRGRQSIRPEICRTYNFGESGSSQGQYFQQFLAPIQLNNASVKWVRKDLSYLLGNVYPGYFMEEVEAARKLSSVEADELKGGAALEEDAALVYANQQEFGAIARKLGIMEDWKDGIPRAAYTGVVTIRYHGSHRLFIMSATFAAQVERAKRKGPEHGSRSRP